MENNYDIIKENRKCFGEGIIMSYILQSDDFVLSLDTEVFETDIKYPCNTILKVSVKCCGFSGNASFDIDIKQFSKFTVDLQEMYETLCGEAHIKEIYGNQRYISFVSNGRGHFSVKGCLSEFSQKGYEQKLEFENDIDQTCLKEFCYTLWNDYKVYLPK